MKQDLFPLNLVVWRHLPSINHGLMSIHCACKLILEMNDALKLFFTSQVDVDLLNVIQLLFSGFEVPIALNKPG